MWRSLRCLLRGPLGWLPSSSRQRAGLAGSWDPASRLAVERTLGPGGSPQGRAAAAHHGLLCPTACLALGLSIKGLLSRGPSGHCLPGPALFLALSACQGPRGTFCGTLQAPEPSAWNTCACLLPLGAGLPGALTVPSASAICPQSSVLSLVSAVPLPPRIICPFSRSCQTSFLKERMPGAQGAALGTAQASCGICSPADLRVRAPPGGVPRWQPAVWERGENVGAGWSSCCFRFAQDSFWTVWVTSYGSHLCPTHRWSAGRT